MKKKMGYLDIIISLLSVIVILLVIGVATTPKDNIMSNKVSTSTVVNNNHLGAKYSIDNHNFKFLNNLFNRNDYYLIEFDSNGGSYVDSQYVEYGDYGYVPEEPVRYGYTFDGWYLNNTRYNFNNVVTKNITLVAHWTKEYNNSWNSDYNNYNRLYEIEFDSNGGTLISAQYVEYGDYAYIPEEPVRYGYTFDGWYLNNTRYNFNKAVTKNITLVAHWTKEYNNNNNNFWNQEYLIEFDSNGGSYVNSQYVEYGNYAYEPEEPVRYGYTFDGWYLNNTRYNFNKAVTKNITLVAHWTKNYINNNYWKEEFKVQFNSNGGMYIPSQYIKYGEYVVEPNDPTREGYSFLGWYLDGVRYNFDKVVTENITLKAEWLKVYDPDYWDAEYIVKFDSNGGNYIASQYVEYGNYAYEPEEPVRYGYIFDGWYLNNTKFNFNRVITNSITLVAHWTKEYDNNWSDIGTQKYNKYCKKEKQTHYSVSYVVEGFGLNSYDWTIKFDDLNAENVKVTDVSYLTTFTDYNKAYIYSHNKQISKVGGNSKYSVPVPYANNFMQHSLKSNNFYNNVYNPYIENGVWYMKADVTVNNYNNTESYYANNINQYIYFVPFKFDIEFTNLDNCKIDLSSRSNSYKDYTVVDTFYR